jgi:hypothetical protein
MAFPHRLSISRAEAALFLFSFQDPPFPFDPPAIAPHFSVFVEHPMAGGDDQKNRMDSGGLMARIICNGGFGRPRTDTGSKTACNAIYMLEIN